MKIAFELNLTQKNA